MKLFGNSDLHLSFAKPKPMDIFGSEWKNHDNKIADNWSRIVSSDDVALIPGDIYWALKYEDVIPDLQYISNLPGIKVIVKGNYDYWWQSVSKLRKESLEGISFIQSNVIEKKGIIISGTRLWGCPYVKWEGFAKGFECNKNKFNSEKIQKRELERLKSCLFKI